MKILFFSDAMAVTVTLSSKRRKRKIFPKKLKKKRNSLKWAMIIFLEVNHDEKIFFIIL